jgi:hypothetical protein
MFMDRKNIAKMTYNTHTKMEYYSAIKKKILSFAGKGIEVEIIMLSKISQTQKDKYHMFSLICGS